MNARELFELAPLGAYVRFNDGTPKPPERHVKKLRAWQHNNAAGYFIRAEPGDGKNDWSRDSFVLQTVTDPVLVVNQHFDARSCTKTFDVTLPKPGTILAVSEFVGQREVRYVWRDWNDVRAWAHGGRARYSLSKCSYEIFIVGEDGRTLVPATDIPEDVA